MPDGKDDSGGATSDNRREDERAPITLRVDYKRLNTFFADYTKNISKGGTFIQTARLLPIGTEFRFALSFPGAEGETVQIELMGIVRWHVTESAATPEKPTGMGIRFVFEEEGQRRALEAAVTAMMNEALGPALATKLLEND